MANLAGIDLGTSSVKVIVIDEKGQILFSTTKDYKLSSPREGWFEQDPNDWVKAVDDCLSEITIPIDAIGLSGQMHGSVFLDKDGKILAPAMLWCDQRTKQETEEMASKIGLESIVAETMNPPLTGFQAPKILWLRNNHPDLFRKISKVLLPKDYLSYHLTGNFATEPSDASGTGLFNVEQRLFSHFMVESLGLDLDLFPPVLESDQVIGPTKSGVPVVAGAGDQSAGGIGVGAVDPNVVSLSLGTSGVIFSSISQPSPSESGSVHVFCHSNRAWHAMGVMLSCGGAMTWMRDLVSPQSSYGEFEEMARSASMREATIRFIPTLAGERCPFVDPDARGELLGLSLSHGRKDLALAAYTGVTHHLNLCLDKLRAFGVNATKLRVTGGGAKSDFWLQLIADWFEIPCVRLAVDEGPAFGAAILAGVGIGIWNNVQEAMDIVKETEIFIPDPERVKSIKNRYVKQSQG